MHDLISQYRKLIDIDLPAKYTSPVRFNHCFNRIILDWLFDDCWYNHLDRKQTAIKQLSGSQFKAAIKRMEEWMQNQQVLYADNEKSLSVRNKKRSRSYVHPVLCLPLTFDP